MQNAINRLISAFHRASNLLEPAFPRPFNYGFRVTVDAQEASVSLPIIGFDVFVIFESHFLLFSATGPHVSLMSAAGPVRYAKTSAVQTSTYPSTP